MDTDKKLSQKRLLPGYFKLWQYFLKQNIRIAFNSLHYYLLAKMSKSKFYAIHALIATRNNSAWTTLKELHVLGNRVHKEPRSCFHAFIWPVFNFFMHVFPLAVALTGFLNSSAQNHLWECFGQHQFNRVVF